MIKLDNLSKRFGAKVSLDNLTLEQNEPMIIGLVGNNGAGKTTLINILTGNYKPTSGNVEMLGRNPRNNQYIASNCILVDEKMRYDPLYNLDQIVEHYSEYSIGFDKNECHELMDVFGLPNKRRYVKLSKGMKNQFNICIGIASNREVTIYDEPVSGLDEMARDKFYKILNENYCKKNKLAIVSTHLLAELQNITTKLIVMRDSKIVYFGETELISMLFVNLIGNMDKISPLLNNRKIYAEECMMNLHSCTLENNFSRNELKYIEEQGLTIQPLKPNTCCKIICNTDYVVSDNTISALKERFGGLN